MNFLVYKASAGSGKTYTLVKEYLKMALKDKNDPSAFRRILAITFTNKAAAEMKERVIKNLHDISAGKAKIELVRDICDALEIEQQELVERSKNCLSAILHQYTDFSIGTIDSFMHRVVKTFAFDLKLPVNFNVELDSEVVLRLAIEQVLDKVGENQSITKALVGFTESKTEEEKNMRIEQELYEAASDLLNEESALLIKKLQHLTIEDFLEIRQKLFLQVIKLVEAFNTIGDLCLLKLEEAGLETGDFYQSRSGIGKLMLLLQHFSVGDLFVMNSYQQKAIYEDVWYSKSADAGKKEQIDAVSGELKSLIIQAIDLWERNSSEYILSCEILKSIYAVALLNEISLAIDKIRDDEFIVHISEFNRRVAEIVNNEPAPFIFERLGERYQHYLIDEFQDTSVIQWQNIIPLVNNGLASNHASIIVGDGKQAIYRFRGGEVEQFAKFPEPYPSNLNPTQVERYTLFKHFYKPENLSKNWRSKPEVVNFNNDFYEFLSEEVLAPSLKDVYLDHKQELPGKAEGGYVEFRFTSNDFIKEEREAFHLENCEKIIRDMKDNKGYQYKDIALLTRNNIQGTMLAAYLLNIGIPVISNESLLVKNAPEVRMLLAWMNILIRNQVSLYMFEVLKLLNDSGILKYSSYEELISDIKLSENEVFAKLNELQRLPDIDKLRTMSLTEICFDLCRVYEFDIQKNTYIHFFLESVWSLSKNQSSDIPVFLDFWEEKKDKLSISLPQDANAVKIMTVHKSKGLQFPVVILPFAHGQRPRNTSKWVEDEENLPAQLNAVKLEFSNKVSQTNLAHLVEQEQERETLDNLNLLYVATTRAEDALYILSGHSGNKGSLQIGWESYIEAYVVDRFGPDAIESGCSIGDVNFENAREQKTEENLIEFNTYELGNWSEKIKISRQSNLIWDTQREPALIQRGKIIHRLLSEVKTQDDIQTQLNILSDEGVLEIEFMNELKEYANEVIQHEEIQSLLQRANEIISEKSLLLQNGEILRPDRVFILDDEVVVLDYKSGLKKPEHQNQLKNYMNALKPLYSKPIRGMLAYLSEELQIEHVS